jgi:two-component system cell cycle response regulator
MTAHILIIEDNQANLELMAYLLQAFGHIPLTASGGEQGVATARREKLDLIICDVHMPGMDGYAVATEIKADTALRAIPLLAVTALAMVGDRDRVLAAGFDGYITKPIDPETFVTQVEAFLRPEQRSLPFLSTPATAVTASIPAKRATIVVIDDRPVNLDLQRSILEPLGYTVITASSMSEGLQLIHQALPDLIISDVQMSEGTGFELIKIIKADPQIQHIPVMFISATYCDETSRRKGLALGAAEYLFRPIDPETFLAEIEACLGGE